MNSFLTLISNQSKTTQLMMADLEGHFRQNTTLSLLDIIIIIKELRNLGRHKKEKKKREMALLVASPFNTKSSSSNFSISSFPKISQQFFYRFPPSSSSVRRPNHHVISRRHRRGIMTTVVSCLKSEEQNAFGNQWGIKVSAVLFDMDGVLCNSEEPSRMAAVHLFAEMGVQVTTDEFAPFTGTGEANFLGGVAGLKGMKGFNTEAAKKRFFEIYLDKYAKPNSGIGFPGALELITECKRIGLKVAVASSADRIKVDANLAAAGLPLSMFDVIVSADAFENLKPAPDIFLAASKSLNVPPSECIVIEDALAGVQAAKAAQMRCIAVTTSLPEETLAQAGHHSSRKT